MGLDRFHTIKQFRYLPGDQKNDSENIDVLRLKMQKDKRGITKCQREHEWVKLNQVLHSGKFKEQDCFKFVLIC